ncbi:MAG: WbqC family protein [Bacteroidales bacterium]|nr:WbqC family protein [Bacteroidales bacterium]
MESQHSAVLLSSAYLPPISWMKAALTAGKVRIEAFETYPKQTYRNRCRIITANGIQALSIPVNKIDGRHTKIRDIEIVYDEPWQRLHWRSIDAAYSNSPFYLYYKDKLDKYFKKEYRFLLDLNMEITNTLFSLLKISVDIEFTEEFLRHPSEISDQRTTFSPKHAVDITQFTPYHQVFEERYGFVPDLSVIDLLFNEGPAAISALNSK